MLTKKTLLLRAIATVLCGAFIAQELHAAPVVSSAPDAKTLQNALVSDPNSLEVPLDFARLSEIEKGSKQALILHIQDAHSNTSGQQNLAATLDSLMKKYGVRLVLSEGGEGDCSLTSVKKIASPAAWKRVARTFLLSGEIQGEEYLNLTSDHPMKIIGVEDMALYGKSLDNYAALAGKREKAVAHLELVERALGKLKNRLYPKELKEYEALRAEESFESAYRKYLAMRGASAAPAGSQSARMASLLEKEARLNFDLANLERAVLLDELRQKGGAGELGAQLAKEKAGLRTNAALYAHFQRTLNLARESGINVARFENLNAHLEYLRAFAAIDMDALLDEWEAGEEALYTETLGEGDALVVRGIDRFVAHLRAAHEIRMTTPEHDRFKADEPAFPVYAMEGFLNRKLAEQGYFDDFVPVDMTLDEARKAIDAFYDSVTERDRAFVANAEKALTDENEKAAFLITGGYHTPHLKKLMREKGFGYAVLTPVVAGETNQKKYEKLILSQRKSDTLRPMLAATPQNGSRMSKLTEAVGARTAGHLLAGTVKTKKERLAAVGVRLSDIAADAESLRERLQALYGPEFEPAFGDPELTSKARAESVGGLRYIDHGGDLMTFDSEAHRHLVFKVFKRGEDGPYYASLKKIIETVQEHHPSEIKTVTIDGIELYSIPGLAPFNVIDGLIVQQKARRGWWPERKSAVAALEKSLESAGLRVVDVNERNFMWVGGFFGMFGRYVIVDLKAVEFLPVTTSGAVRSLSGAQTLDIRPVPFDATDMPDPATFGPALRIERDNMSAVLERFGFEGMLVNLGSGLFQLGDLPLPVVNVDMMNGDIGKLGNNTFVSADFTEDGFAERLGGITAGRTVNVVFYNSMNFFKDDGLYKSGERVLETSLLKGLELVSEGGYLTLIQYSTPGGAEKQDPDALVYLERSLRILQNSGVPIRVHGLVTPAGQAVGFVIQKTADVRLADAPSRRKVGRGVIYWAVLIGSSLLAAWTMIAHAVVDFAELGAAIDPVFLVIKNIHYFIVPVFISNHLTSMYAAFWAASAIYGTLQFIQLVSGVKLSERWLFGAAVAGGILINLWVEISTGLTLLDVLIGIPFAYLGARFTRATGPTIIDEDLPKLRELQSGATDGFLAKGSRIGVSELYGPFDDDVLVQKVGKFFAEEHEIAPGILFGTQKVELKDLKEALEASKERFFWVQFVRYPKGSLSQPHALITAQPVAPLEPDTDGSSKAVQAANELNLGLGELRLFNPSSFHQLITTISMARARLQEGAVEGLSPVTDTVALVSVSVGRYITGAGITDPEKLGNLRAAQAHFDNAVRLMREIAGARINVYEGHLEFSSVMTRRIVAARLQKYLDAHAQDGLERDLMLGKLHEINSRLRFLRAMSREDLRAALNRVSGNDPHLSARASQILQEIGSSLLEKERALDRAGEPFRGKVGLSPAQAELVINLLGEHHANRVLDFRPEAARRSAPVVLYRIPWTDDPQERRFLGLYNNNMLGFSAEFAADEQGRKQGFEKAFKDFILLEGIHAGSLRARHLWYRFYSMVRVGTYDVRLRRAVRFLSELFKYEDVAAIRGAMAAELEHTAEIEAFLGGLDPSADLLTLETERKRALLAAVADDFGVEYEALAEASVPPAMRGARIADLKRMAMHASLLSVARAAHRQGRIERMPEGDAMVVVEAVSRVARSVVWSPLLSDGEIAMHVKLMMSLRPDLMRDVASGDISLAEVIWAIRFLSMLKDVMRDTSFNVVYGPEYVRVHRDDMDPVSIEMADRPDSVVAITREGRVSVLTSVRNLQFISDTDSNRPDEDALLVETDFGDVYLYDIQDQLHEVVNIFPHPERPGWHLFLVTREESEAVLGGGEGSPLVVVPFFGFRDPLQADGSRLAGHFIALLASASVTGLSALILSVAIAAPFGSAYAAVVILMSAVIGAPLLALAPRTVSGEVWAGAGSGMTTPFLSAGLLNADPGVIIMLGLMLMVAYLFRAPPAADAGKKAPAAGPQGSHLSGPTLSRRSFLAVSAGFTATLTLMSCSPPARDEEPREPAASVPPPTQGPRLVHGAWDEASRPRLQAMQALFWDFEDRHMELTVDNIEEKYRAFYEALDAQLSPERRVTAPVWDEAAVETLYHNARAEMAALGALLVFKQRGYDQLQFSDGRSRRFLFRPLMRGEVLLNGQAASNGIPVAFSTSGDPLLSGSGEIGITIEDSAYILSDRVDRLVAELRRQEAELEAAAPGIGRLNHSQAVGLGYSVDTPEGASSLLFMRLLALRPGDDQRRQAIIETFGYHEEQHVLDYLAGIAQGLDERVSEQRARLKSLAMRPWADLLSIAAALSRASAQGDPAALAQRDIALKLVEAVLRDPAPYGIVVDRSLSRPQQEAQVVGQLDLLADRDIRSLVGAIAREMGHPGLVAGSRLSPLNDALSTSIRFLRAFDRSVAALQSNAQEAGEAWRSDFKKLHADWVAHIHLVHGFETAQLRLIENALGEANARKGPAADLQGRLSVVRQALFKIMESTEAFPATGGEAELAFPAGAFDSVMAAKSWLNEHGALTWQAGDFGQVEARFRAVEESNVHLRVEVLFTDEWKAAHPDAMRQLAAVEAEDNGIGAGHSGKPGVLGHFILRWVADGTHAPYVIIEEVQTSNGLRSAEKTADNRNGVHKMGHWRYAGIQRLIEMAGQGRTALFGAVYPVARASNGLTLSDNELNSHYRKPFAGKQWSQKIVLTDGLLRRMWVHESNEALLEGQAFWWDGIPEAMAGAAAGSRMTVTGVLDRDGQAHVGDITIDIPSRGKLSEEKRGFELTFDKGVPDTIRFSGEEGEKEIVFVQPEEGPGRVYLRDYFKKDLLMGLEKAFVYVRLAKAGELNLGGGPRNIDGSVRPKAVWAKFQAHGGRKIKVRVEDGFPVHVAGVESDLDELFVVVRDKSMLKVAASFYSKAPAEVLAQLNSSHQLENVLISAKGKATFGDQTVDLGMEYAGQRVTLDVARDASTGAVRFELARQEGDTRVYVPARGINQDQAPQTLYPVYLPADGERRSFERGQRAAPFYKNQKNRPPVVVDGQTHGTYIVTGLKTDANGVLQLEGLIRRQFNLFPEAELELKVVDGKAALVRFLSDGKGQPVLDVAGQPLALEVDVVGKQVDAQIRREWAPLAALKIDIADEMLDQAEQMLTPANIRKAKWLLGRVERGLDGLASSSQDAFRQRLQQLKQRAAEMDADIAWADEMTEDAKMIRALDRRMTAQLNAERRFMRQMAVKAKRELAAKARSERQARAEREANSVAPMQVIRQIGAESKKNGVNVDPAVWQGALSGEASVRVASRQTIIESYMGIALDMVGKLAPVYTELHKDLVQDAMEGLWEALNVYLEEKGASSPEGFKEFAVEKLTVWLKRSRTDNQRLSWFVSLDTKLRDDEEKSSTRLDMLEAAEDTSIEPYLVNGNGNGNGKPVFKNPLLTAIFDRLGDEEADILLSYALKQDEFDEIAERIGKTTEEVQRIFQGIIDKAQELAAGAHLAGLDALSADEVESRIRGAIASGAFPVPLTDVNDVNYTAVVVLRKVDGKWAMLFRIGETDEEAGISGFTFSLPAGKLEKSEKKDADKPAAVRRAARRELAEEAGLIIGDEALIGPLADVRDKKKSHLRLFLHVDRTDKQPADALVGADFVWVPLTPYLAFRGEEAGTKVLEYLTERILEKRPATAPRRAEYKIRLSLAREGLGIFFEQMSSVLAPAGARVTAASEGAFSHRVAGLILMATAIPMLLLTAWGSLDVLLLFLLDPQWTLIGGIQHYLPMTAGLAVSLFMAVVGARHFSTGWLPRALSGLMMLPGAIAFIGLGTALFPLTGLWGGASIALGLVLTGLAVSEITGPRLSFRGAVVTSLLNLLMISAGLLVYGFIGLNPVTIGSVVAGLMGAAFGLGQAIGAGRMADRVDSLKRTFGSRLTFGYLAAENRLFPGINLQRGQVDTSAQTYSYAALRDDSGKIPSEMSYMRVGRVIVASRFHRHSIQEAGFPEDAVIVYVDAPFPFGTYSAAVIALMQEMDLKGKTVVDMGAGTGILSLVALALGAERVLAIEADMDDATGASNALQRAGYEGRLVRAPRGVPQGFIRKERYIVHQGDLGSWFDLKDIAGHLGVKSYVVLANMGRYDAYPIYNRMLSFVREDPAAEAGVLGGYREEEGFGLGLGADPSTFVAPGTTIRDSRLELAKDRIFSAFSFQRAGARVAALVGGEQRLDLILRTGKAVSGLDPKPEKTGFYAGMGGDAAYAFLVAGDELKTLIVVDELSFVSDPEDPRYDSGGLLDEMLLEYKEQKMAKGFGVGETMRKAANVYPFIRWELETMGATNITVERSGLKHSIRFDLNGSPRTILYIRGDVDDAADILEDRETVLDVFILKAGEYYENNREWERMIQRVIDGRLRVGGVAVIADRGLPPLRSSVKPQGVPNPDGVSVGYSNTGGLELPPGLLLYQKTGARINVTAEILEQDSQFAEWVKNEMAVRDRAILEAILSASENRLAEILRQNPYQVYLTDVQTPQDARNGRSVNFRLSVPFGDIQVLRLKGVRPRWRRVADSTEGIIGRHEGRGLPRRDYRVSREGNLELFEPQFSPQGTMGLSDASNEYRVMLEGQKGLGFLTDRPIAYGIFRGIRAESGEAEVGFVIAGMTDEDKRLVTKEVGTPYVREAYREFGRQLRAFHDAGYFHRWPHLGNVGFYKTSENKPKVVLRDLDDVASRADLFAGLSPNASRRVETAHRFRDVEYAIRRTLRKLYWSDIEDTFVNREFGLEPFLSGYFERDLSPRQIQELSDNIMNGNFTKFLRFAETAIVLGDDTPEVGVLWTKLYAASGTRVAGTFDIVRAPDQSPEQAIFEQWGLAQISAMAGQAGGAQIKVLKAEQVDDAAQTRAGNSLFVVNMEFTDGSGKTIESGLAITGRDDLVSDIVIDRIQGDLMNSDQRNTLYRNVIVWLARSQGFRNFHLRVKDNPFAVAFVERNLQALVAEGTIAAYDKRGAEFLFSVAGSRVAETEGNRIFKEAMRILDELNSIDMKGVLRGSPTEEFARMANTLSSGDVRYLSHGGQMMVFTSDRHPGLIFKVYKIGDAAVFAREQKNKLEAMLEFSGRRKEEAVVREGIWELLDVPGVARSGFTKDGLIIQEFGQQAGSDDELMSADDEVVFINGDATTKKRVELRALIESQGAYYWEWAHFNEIKSRGKLLVSDLGAIELAKKGSAPVGARLALVRPIEQTAIIFPPSGNKPEEIRAASKGLYEDPTARSVYDSINLKASEVLGRPFDVLRFDAEDAAETQLAITAHQIALWEVYKQRLGGRQPKAVLGISRGSWAAHYAVGVLDLERIIELDIRNVRLLEEASRLTGGRRMGLLTGIRTQDLEPALRRHRASITVHLARDRFIVSVPSDGLEAFQREAQGLKARFLPSQVRFASHDPHFAQLQALLNEYRDYLEKDIKPHLRTPSLAVYSGIRAGVELRSKDDLIREAVEYLYTPIRVDEILPFLQSQGIEQFATLGAEDFIVSHQRRSGLLSPQTISVSAFSADQLASLTAGARVRGVADPYGRLPRHFEANTPLGKAVKANPALFAPMGFEMTTIDGKEAVSWKGMPALIAWLDELQAAEGVPQEQRWTFYYETEYDGETPESLFWDRLGNRAWTIGTEHDATDHIPGYIFTMLSPAFRKSAERFFVFASGLRNISFTPGDFGGGLRSAELSFHANKAMGVVAREASLIMAGSFQELSTRFLPTEDLGSTPDEEWIRMQLGQLEKFAKSPHKLLTKREVGRDLVKLRVTPELANTDLSLEDQQRIAEAVQLAIQNMDIADSEFTEQDYNDIEKELITVWSRTKAGGAQGAGARVTELQRTANKLAPAAGSRLVTNSLAAGSDLSDRDRRLLAGFANARGVRLSHAPAMFFAFDGGVAQVVPIGGMAVGIDPVGAGSRMAVLDLKADVDALRFTVDEAPVPAQDIVARMELDDFNERLRAVVQAYLRFEGALPANYRADKTVEFRMVTPETLSAERRAVLEAWTQAVQKAAGGSVFMRFGISEDDFGPLPGSDDKDSYSIVYLGEISDSLLAMAQGHGIAATPQGSFGEESQPNVIGQLLFSVLIQRLEAPVESLQQMWSNLRASAVDLGPANFALLREVRSGASILDYQDLTFRVHPVSWQAALAGAHLALQALGQSA